MKLKNYEYFMGMLSYAAVGVLGILLSAWLATSFLKTSYSQEPPAATEQPPPPPPPPEPPVAGAPPPAPAELTEAGEGDATKGQENVIKPGIDEELESFLAPYNYDSENRRDPFREFKVELETAVEEGVVIGPLRPLQRFALDEIQLVGIIWDVEEPKAMFLDPNSVIHVLAKDERVGRKNGYIANIREGEVVIVETVKVRGQLAFTTRVMKLTR